MNNWMQYASKKRVGKFQEGGVPMEQGGAPQQAAPEQGGGGGDLPTAIMQAVESGDPAAAQQVLQAIAQDPNMALEVLTMLASAMQGGGGGAPEQGGAPMARNGMQLDQGPMFYI